MWRRHIMKLMSKFYLDTGVMVWNGNGAVGKEMIQKLFMELPASESSLTSMDSHPMLDAAVGTQQTVLIQVAGFIKFQDKLGLPFQQNFMVTAEGDKWKIVNDCFRFQEVVESLGGGKPKF
ncbi:NTF2-related export protein isoform X2 [Ischnura elegans]|uniref:NTF2-related export protein isoform X2 n=1 Tax=Ischnura elegans TaxID=197161 RepID=UPI001ED8997E|nr:NTF2-related export protein isoform X2 [Ischnura elegans]